MIYLAIHLALGALLVAQSVVRRWKYAPVRTLEEVTSCIGVVVIWPYVVYRELRDR